MSESFEQHNNERRQRMSRTQINRIEAELLVLEDWAKPLGNRMTQKRVREEIQGVRALLSHKDLSLEDAHNLENKIATISTLVFGPGKV